MFGKFAGKNEIDSWIQLHAYNVVVLMQSLAYYLNLLCINFQNSSEDNYVPSDSRRNFVACVWKTIARYEFIRELTTREHK